MTKVASAEAIEKAKKDLIDNVKKALSLAEIKQILEDQHNLEISDDIEASKGEIVIHNNRVAYKMAFEVLLSLSVLLDDEGNYIPPEDSPEESIEHLGSQAENIVGQM